MKLDRARKIWFVAPLVALAFAGAGAGAGADVAFAACKKSDKQTEDLSKSQMNRAVKCLINKRRSAANLNSHRNLKQAAQEHSAVMERQNCFSHVCSGEASPQTRIRRAGYSGGAWGEVIAVNSDKASPRDVVEQFMGSSVHRGLILSGRFDRMGTGVKTGGGRAYYTVDLGG